MKTDWSLIKTAFVTSNKTLVDIAEDFKQNLDVVRRHAAKEKWTEQRKLFRVTTTKQAMEKRSTEMAIDIAQFSSDELKLVKAGFSLLVEELKSRKSARDIAAALKSFQEVRMRATGENTTEQNKDINIIVRSEKTKDNLDRIANGEGL